ncbi:MAG TPA: EAL domain-containing protein [Aromatoleum sp.]|uniref:putative bifunctional diguanylate cyclase/phosphodiesterase n=1 Tax=Aromatoleum sp. TaxID=2307007 RepID=UPI002B4A42A2|nr:EAL domain-containing protein [Aromatoleum sp.]HJV25699.1 EAL domain-containing protein [Aromatoleum sp.]
MQHGPLPSDQPPHRLLRHQLRRIFGSEISPRGDWGVFLQTVNAAYYDADRERGLLENALELNAQELTEANNKLRLFTAHAPVGIVMLDRELRYVFASPRWLQQHQLALHDITGRHCREVPLPALDRWQEVLQRTLAEKTELSQEEPVTLHDGRARWMRWEMRPWQASDGDTGGVIVMVEDITDHKRAEEQIRIAAIVFQTRDGMIVTDACGTILQVNQAFTDATGYTAEDAIGKRATLLHSGHQDAAFYRNMWEALTHEGRWEGEIWNRRKDGGVFSEWLIISGIRDTAGRITHYLGTYADISEPREATRKILELAFYDPLTALPNRRLLLDRLHKAFAASARSGQFGAVLLIDLDHFKTLNDTRGHDVGDELLIHVAQRLRESIREADSAARLGGDEFVVLLEGLNEEQVIAANVVETVAGKLRTAISRPVILKGEIHHVTPSIGVTLFRHAKEGAEAVLKQADLALYQAKGAGRNAVRFYNPEMQAAVDARIRLEAGLRRALAEGEFTLHYQPQVDVRGRVTGVEALLRWQAPGQAIVGPADFIPVAEDSGLIVPIGRWVLETACRQLAAWAQDSTTRDLQLAINISARQFRHPDFVQDVRLALRNSGADPRRLQLELIESLVLEDVEHVARTMQVLKQDGVGFSIDDFGTGYSSLAYLKRLPLDQIKIDRSFVRDIADDADDRAIVRAILSLAESLGLQVIAEGVESTAQFDFLAAHGCQGYQGYLFAPPMAVQQMDDQLRRGIGPKEAFSGRADG